MRIAFCPINAICVVGDRLFIINGSCGVEMRFFVITHPRLLAKQAVWRSCFGPSGVVGDLQIQ